MRLVEAQMLNFRNGSSLRIIIFGFNDSTTYFVKFLPAHWTRYFTKILPAANALGVIYMFAHEKTGLLPSLVLAQAN